MPSYRISVDVELDAADKEAAEQKVVNVLDKVVDEIEIINTEELDEVEDESEDEEDENN